MTRPPRSSPRVDYRTDPTQYRHWKLAVEGAVARLSLDIAEDGGIRPGYKLKLNSYDLGVDIELHDALNRVRFEHPASALGHRHQRQGPHLLLGRQHLHAGRLQPRLEGELLQVHQRDAQRHRRLVAAFGPQVPRGRQRRLRRRRLRAGAGLRRDRAGRRPLVVGVAARSAAARRAARHRRPDPRHRQAPCAPRPRRHLLHQRRRRARPARGRVAPGRRRRQAGAVRRRRAGARRQAGRRQRPPGRRQGRAARRASSAKRAPTACATSTSRSRSTARAAPPPSPSRRRRARSRPTWPASRPPAPPGGRSPWRASSTTPSSTCAPTSSTSAPGCSRPKATRRPCWPATRPCSRTKDHWLVRETIGVLRRTLARLDVSSRSLFALIESGSCFAGTLAELAFAADRAYMLALPDDADKRAHARARTSSTSASIRW